MTTVKVTTVGNSVGIVLPREILARLRVDKGDLLYLVETPTGVELTPYVQDMAIQMDALERTARDERDVLRKVAEFNGRDRLDTRPGSAGGTPAPVGRARGAPDQS